MVADNWGGLFATHVMEERDYEPTASDATLSPLEKDWLADDTMTTDYSSDNPDEPMCVTAAPTALATDFVPAVLASVETSPAAFQP